MRLFKHSWKKTQAGFFFFFLAVECVDLQSDDQICRSSHGYLGIFGVYPVHDHVLTLLLWSFPHCPCNQMPQLSHWLHCPSVSLLWGSPVACPLQVHVMFPGTFWFTQVILVHPLDILNLLFPEPIEVPTFSVQLRHLQKQMERQNSIFLSLVRSESAWARGSKSWKNWKNCVN